MQILYENGNNGELQIQIDSLDDLWVLYNILNTGDRIKGRTTRRVVLHEGDPGERKPMTLSINIEKVEFHEFTNRLRVLGSIIEGPEDWVSTGQHHTFNLEPGSKIRIFKDTWYRNDILRIKRNLAKKDYSRILCVAIETGLANVTILSNYSITPVTEIKENIPGKRYKKQFHKEAMEQFYLHVVDVIRDNIERNNIGLIIACGPGFNKEQLYETYKEIAEKEKISIPMRTINASSGEISAVYEILRNGAIATIKSDSKMIQDEMIMAKFIEGLGKDDSSVVYGIDQVELTSQMGAIDHLLICDSYLRTSDHKIRKRIEDTLNLTEQNRGEVHILSTNNPSGDQLEAYGRIAGILRFKINY